ncbi:MAG: DUF4179 domain-containing protein [Christensenellales bacterium]|jgi:hypothetical protein|nr:DUF4179 domain-containing protein [Clostridiales bacterium]
MNDKRDKDFVQHSIDTVLSSIQGDPWLAQKIMHQERTENTVMKKKISTTLIAAIVLILATVTTLAATGAFQKLWEVWQNSFQKMNTTGAIEIIEEFDQEGFEKEYGGVKEDLVISTVPQDKDLDYEQAFAIARKAIIDAFGTPEEELDAMGVYPNFFHSPYEDEVNEWEFYITPRKGVNIDEDHDYGPPGEYRVTVASPSGEVMMCNWYLDDFFPDYARRTWEAGKKDYVFGRAKNVQFFMQPFEDQVYFMNQFEEAGYDLSQIQKSDEEMLSRLETTLAFAEPDENLLYADTPEVKAAIAAMEKVSGLTKQQMEKFSFILLPSPIASATRDYCFSFNYEIQFQKLEENRVTEFENRILSYISRLGHHMICLDPDTLEAVKTVHANRTPAYEKADDPSALLGRRNWTNSDIPEFEALVNEAALIDRELEKGTITRNEAEKKFRQLMLAYGGDPAIYGTNP